VTFLLSVYQPNASGCFATWRLPFSSFFFQYSVEPSGGKVHGRFYGKSTFVYQSFYHDSETVALRRQAEPGQVPPEGGEAARAFSSALAEEHPSRAQHFGERAVAAIVAAEHDLYETVCSELTTSVAVRHCDVFVCSAEADAQQTLGLNVLTVCAIL
jgi:hypothetical protein